ncbi:hypothetical protein Athai_34900 [Actinocatenispora thailandica]|uniref:SMI1/KNR4 family protein n=1 Tax=Actinocatenispora thailandica TaxID=227318 RepID=A0A7R7DR34_9ACTN|nr:hypothetical protein [Actinocatenispora thailandica]BCJ35987.1 hypothetical protein Athai_34900 [Actinocatenispora thailandica]
MTDPATLLPAPLAPGLTEAELAAVEARYGFRFAADHRALLGAALPVGRGFPDWRNGDPEELRDRLGWPVAGVLFDVEHGGFWYPGWGPRPVGTADALAVARGELRAAPPLVPIYSHRYLPGVGGPAGHPVLSMHQTDIVVYGADLARYLRAEFGGVDPAEASAGARPTVPFWSELVG